MNQTDEWRDKDPDKETSEKWHKDPNNWIWGLFYYNKEDKRIFPPKRIEWMGFTTNFANTKSIISLLIVLAFIGLMIFIMENKK